MVIKFMVIKKLKETITICMHSTLPGMLQLLHIIDLWVSHHHTGQAGRSYAWA
jgi:hypothetical protein